jgi:hypothetical protein
METLNIILMKGRDFLETNSSLIEQFVGMARTAMFTEEGGDDP